MRHRQPRGDVDAHDDRIGVAVDSERRCRRAHALRLVLPDVLGASDGERAAPGQAEEIAVDWGNAMFVVAILELATPVEAEAECLAADLGATVYESRLLLATPPPTIVLTTPDRARAAALLGKLRARGHGVVACDGAAVAGPSAMTSVRRFRLGDDAIHADERTSDTLPFADVMALLPAQHRVQVEKNTQHTEKKFDMTRAIVSGGLMVRKKVTHTSHAVADERERVLYLFRASGASPWILREHEASYASLARVAPTARENFDTTVASLRERAPDAIYDARLLATRRVPETMRVAGDARAQTLTTSSASGVDLLAHLLALWLSKRARGAEGPR